MKLVWCLWLCECEVYCLHKPFEVDGACSWALVSMISCCGCVCTYTYTHACAHSTFTVFLSVCCTVNNVIQHDIANLFSVCEIDY